MLQSLKKNVYRLLALSGIRAPVRLLLRLGKQNLVPAVVNVPDVGRVLILAPHMDDETIGCGGAIQAHIKAGAVVQVVFITNGAQGFEAPELETLSAEQRRDIRRVECEKACAILGVSDIHYLNLPDGTSSADQAATDTLLGLFEQHAPELVYLPFLTDSHHDHFTCNLLFQAVCQRSAVAAGVLCSCYEVWTPLHPNCIVDITPFMDSKMQALACYESQLKMNNYLSSVKGLGAYRAIGNRSQGYAEAFYVTTATDYLSFFSEL